jgi:hypothetical protein
LGFKITLSTWVMPWRAAQKPGGRVWPGARAQLPWSLQCNTQAVQQQRVKAGQFIHI